MVSKVEDIRALIVPGGRDPTEVFPVLRALAASPHWQTREVAATALVELAKRQPEAVANEARVWALDADPNLRRAASEGLRGLVKVDPAVVRPVLDLLRSDADIYVRKSVANVLRNASAKHADFVLDGCRVWARSSNAHTRWIVRAGLRKLQTTRPDEVAAILHADTTL